MDIQQAKQLKHELEKDILKLIDKFEHVTTLSVSDVSTSRNKTMSGKSQTSNVSVTVEVQ